MPNNFQKVSTLALTLFPAAVAMRGFWLVWIILIAIFITCLFLHPGFKYYKKISNYFMPISIMFVVFTSFLGWAKENLYVTASHMNAFALIALVLMVFYSIRLDR